MNKVQLIGRIGRDPEGGQAVKVPYANFSLATHEYWTDRITGERREHTEWHNVVCFDRLAEFALAYLSKGSEVYVEGRQRTTQWIDKEGHEHRRTEVRPDELKMLRRAPQPHPMPQLAKGLVMVEVMLRDVAAGQREDVSLHDLAAMLAALRVSLAREEEPGHLDLRGPAPAVR